MRVLHAEFYKTVAPSGERKAEAIPEFCFIGRSNVGKSSLINRLAMHKVARTSSTPGAARTINLYKISCESMSSRKWLLFSDFPGFGYSKVSKSTYQGWEDMIDRYITQNKLIKRLLWIFDVRRDFDSLDETVLEWLRYRRLPFTLVLTKIDKERRDFANRRKEQISQEHGISPIYLFSSKDGFGRKELLSHILSVDDEDG
jgi:GTP-binding protein